MAYSQITKPDFAFPQTTLKEAGKALKEAEKKHDAYLALNALLVSTVAENAIDRNSIDMTIAEVETAKAKFSDDDLVGLFDGLLARLYLYAYNANRWTYDRRALPLLPYPKNIKEWSGDQYKAKIEELCQNSVDVANIQKLSKHSILDYPAVIDCDQNSAIYFPTLADFAYQNAAQIYSNCYSEGLDSLLVKARDNSTTEPAKIQWQCQIDNNSKDKFAALKADYEQYIDNQYSGLILAYMYNALSDIESKTYFKQAANRYITKFPDSALKGIVEFDLKSVLLRRTSIQVANICGVNRPFEVKVDITNANYLQINAYYVGERIDNLKGNILNYYKGIIKDNKPAKSIEIRNDRQTPFECDTTVTLALERPGFYIIIPQIPGVEDQSYYNVTRCVPLLPLVLNGGQQQTQVITVDSYTGKPIGGVDVSTKVKNKAVNIGKTDADGIVDYTLKNERWTQGITLTYNGKVYQYDNVSINCNKVSDSDQINRNANVLTDRAIYHPGEELNVLGVVYEAITKTDNSQLKNLLKNVNVRFELRNTNWEVVDTLSTTTDEFGRATAKFTLPTEGLTGRYNVQCIMVKNGDNLGSRNIMVSDYRMPDFELNIATVECDTPNKGDVTVTGDATSYSGMPITDATLTLTLRKSSWWWRNSDGEIIYTAEFKTDDTGKFSYVIPDSVFVDNKSDMFNLQISAASITGSTAEAERSFSLTEKYYVEVSIDNSNIDGEKPFTPEVRITAADGSKVEIPLVWTLKQGNDTIASAEYYGRIDLSKIAPGNYDLSFTSKTPGLANTTDNNITIYNVSSGKVPSADLWVEKSSYNLNGAKTIDVLLSTANDEDYVYYSLISRGQLLYTKVVKYQKGYHTLSAELPDGVEDSNLKLINVSKCQVYTHEVTITNTKPNNLEIVGESFRDNLIPGAKETWSMRVVNADGTPVISALALDMYNKALDAIYPHSFDIRFQGIAYYGNINYDYPHYYGYNSSIYENLDQKYELVLSAPTFFSFGNINSIFGRPRELLSFGTTGIYGSRTSDEILYNTASPYFYDDSYSMPVGSYKASMRAAAVNDLAAPMAMVTEAVEEEKVADDGDNAVVEIDNFDYRDSDVPLAIWAPVLTTDADGNVQYTFTVPNANTTWRLRAVAWSKDMQIGSLMRDFVASKPVMVQPNQPRFLRSGDTATILASVMNNSDTTATVTTVIELFNPLTSEVLSTRTYTDEIASKQSAKVGINVKAGSDMAAFGYRVRSTNGHFSDGEQNVIRILPSVAQLIETEPFYLNPGETTYTTVLPAEKDARISLTFCENPAWTIVSALPGLRTQINDYANSAAAALYSAAIARGIIKENPAIGQALKQWKENPTDSTLVSMLQKNEDLKIALLNSTPWVMAAQSDTERMANLSMIFDDSQVNNSIASAIKILDKLQMSDGGWAWGDWCKESSVWVTSNVLSMLGDLKALGWLPNDKKLNKMIERAVNYYDKKVEDTDLQYCLIRPLFSNISVNKNGNKVIKATLADIRKHWKKTMDPAYKAMEAQALYINGDKATALKLMSSLSEFGVYTESQGLKFPSVNALYNYAIILDAYSTILPDSKEVDGMRQQLIVRKQGTDWGDAVVTTEVVKSILSSGSRWTVDAKGAKIKVGDAVIEPNGPIETATGSLSANLSNYAGQTLTVTTTGVGPAYGAVFAQFAQKMQDVKADACDDLSIEKQLYVRRGSDWAIAEDLKVGDRVKVQLTINCKRNLSYVSIIDERPAAFEPVEQLPGWIWSEGLGFYRENRDSMTDLHIVYMRPGTYLLTYEMNVNVAGQFSSGVATIQSQYAPEISAHSSGSILTIK